MIDPPQPPPTLPPLTPAALENEEVLELTSALPAQDSADPDSGKAAGTLIDPENLNERRMSVRAYLYWASLLQGRNFPSVADLDAMEVQEFRDNSVLLDFSRDIEQPIIRYAGTKLRDDAGISLVDVRPADVPGRSLISRLTDHYLEIIANRAPVGFEAEFINRHHKTILYRGILMPLSDDGYTINFIFGVMSWCDATNAAPTTGKPSAFEEFVAGPAIDEASSKDQVQALEALVKETAAAFQKAEPNQMPEADFAAETTHSTQPQAAEKPEELVRQALHLAQSAAAHAETVDQRSRGALYNALAAAYGFHLQATNAPDLYEKLIAEQGLSIQKRAPFTPTVKLVFGARYDKTRLTEYAATLSYAKREGIGVEGLQTLLQQTAGGIKAIVALERAHRRAGQSNYAQDKQETVLEQLRKAPSLGHVSLVQAGLMPPETPASGTGAQGTGDGEFCVLLARRSANGEGFDILSPLATTPTQISHALRQVAAKTKTKKTRAKPKA
jgi:hypothetical protein